ncbi:hypothetical protein D3C87_102650 [compost metagenome]
MKKRTGLQKGKIMRILLALSFSVLMALMTNISFAKAAIPSNTDRTSCDLTSEGIFKGSWVKHRILVGEDVIYGANDMDAILSQLDNLRNQGLCQ